MDREAAMTMSKKAEFLLGIAEYLELGEYKEAEDVVQALLNDALNEHESSQRSSGCESTLIDPADIRPGDVVERVMRMTVARRNSTDLISTAGYAYSLDDDVTWHLVSRPDTDAEAVEALLQAGPAMLAEFRRAKDEGVTKEADEQARDYLAALREQGWDVVRRAES